MHAVNVLDNPVWHALTGPQANVAEAHGRAVRFDPAISVFAGVPDDPTPEDWDALGALTSSKPAVIVRDEITVPPGWTEGFRAPGAQMICAQRVTDIPTVEPLEVETLTAADVPEMLDLVKRTQPGPLLPRTIELGTYVGIRAPDGALVAMAGSRMHLPGYTEISAVCTDAEHRGRGLAQVLVARLVDEVLDRGELACLHVVTDNLPAIRLYERLGFTTRREMDFAFLRTPAC
jgi:predicted GNAT family acetyltransferase